MPDVLHRMRERFLREAPASHLGKLWTATYVLMGLRFQQPFINNLLREVMGMEESVTYQAIIAKGKVLGKVLGKQEGAIDTHRKVLLLQGRDRIGKPSARVKAAIQAIDNAEEFERLIVRLLHVESWAELLSDSKAKRHD